MKRIHKRVAVCLCCALFAIFSLGSGSTEDSQKKEVVVSENGETQSKNVEEKGTAEKSSKKEISIEEQVLLNEKGIVITAQKYVEDSIWGDGIKLLIENNGDKTVNVGCEALIVNDYMITDLFASEIAPGKKANETLNLSSTELKSAGIEMVGKIEVYFYVTDTQSWDTILKTDCITIKTSEYENMDTKADDSGAELYNGNGIRIVGKTVDENSFWGTAILLYIENNSGRNVGISVDEMSINGFMVDPFFATTIYNGKKAIDDVTVFSSTLEENGIKQIEDVELKFHIYDDDTYDTLVDSDPITFSAK